MIVHNLFCLKLTKSRIEELTHVGKSTTFECKYDLQGEKLYSFKWYKDGNEFYRFLPKETPEVQLFEVGGVHVDDKLSTAESVVLNPLELASSGKYCCEVSTEAPFFLTVSNCSSMLTITLSDKELRMSGGQVDWKLKKLSALVYQPRDAGGLPIPSINDQDVDVLAVPILPSSNGSSSMAETFRTNGILLCVIYLFHI